MKITSAEFIKSAFDKTHWTTDGRPEIAFLGRSNVGKSSLINSLLLRKGLARTSNTPGRTQSINFFLINGKHPVVTAPGSDRSGFYFTDLPGYGYARVSKTMRADWGKMAEEYLEDRRELALSVQLIDSRHSPTELDLQLNEWLSAKNKNFVVVATKADKLSRNETAKNLSVASGLLSGVTVIPYSAQTDEGRDAVWVEITDAIKKYQLFS